MQYYTAWLVIPAVGGLAISLYQYIRGGVETPLVAVYSMCLCLWVTVFIESWKRKAAEISLKWGVLERDELDRSQVRDEFLGDDYFSPVTQRIERGH